MRPETPPQSLSLAEWETRTPDRESVLRNLFLDGEARTLARVLTRSRCLLVRELRDGLSIQATSYVGHVQIGPLRVTVVPKLRAAPLMILLRYAYGLRELDLQDQVEQPLSADSMADVLLYQLAAEVTELVERGLHRTYLRRSENLQTVRGRIDLQRLARKGGVMAASLPCIHNPRSEDGLLNRVLLGGLRLGISQAGHLGLRRRLHRLASLLDGSVSQAPICAATIARALQQSDRRTSAYVPALRIIALLHRGDGIGMEDTHRVRLPGFLFDMNRFFQALLSRFLHEHLDGFTLEDEYTLRGMMAYMPEHNPLHRQAPRPRPDFVLREGRRITAILDAKYRDLWTHKLPREMLYQLAVYSMVQGKGGRATILYPTLESAAREQVISIKNPVDGESMSSVVLRPVDLLALARLTVAEGPVTELDRVAFARRLACGGDVAK